MNFIRKEISTNNSTSNKKTNRATVVLSLAIVAMLVGSAAVASVAAFTPTYTMLTINASGSTFVNPLMSQWASAFASTMPSSEKVTISYAAVGSGQGIKNTYGSCGGGTLSVGFGATDAPVSPFNHPIPSCDGGTSSGTSSTTYGNILQFPESLGGVAFFYNIPGVSTSLKLTGQILADIYLGTITTWNDPAIAALNPGVVPASDCSPTACTITPVWRSDSSGTSYAFSQYVSEISSHWDTQINAYNGVPSCTANPLDPCYTTNLFNFLGSSYAAGAKGIGQSGSGGVAAYVEGHSYTIGYADTYYAFDNHLQAASIQNAAGNFVAPSVPSISTAAAAFASVVLANPIAPIVNPPASATTAYPDATFTYIVVWQQQDKITPITGNSAPVQQEQGNDVAQFLWWIVTQGQAFSSALYYVPLPTGLVQADESVIQQIEYSGVPYINAATTTTVHCLVSSEAVGISTTCSATVGNQTPTPTGSVTWSHSGAGSVSFSSPTCTLSSGSCSVTVKGSTAGSGTVQASYSGDNYDAVSQGTAALAVTKGTTSTGVTCTGSLTFPAGTSVLCTATVTGTAPTHTGTITWSKISGSGSVTFSSSLCSLSAGKCSVSVKGTVAGSVTFQASYGGDSNNLGSHGTASRTIAKAASYTTISCTATSFALGHSVTCTATVTGTAPTHTGTITWSKISGSGSVTFSHTTCTLSAGKCSVTVTGTLTGTLTVEAKYSGDTSNVLSDRSVTLTVT